MSRDTKMLAQSGLIAALYAVLCMVSTALGLSSGAVQLRLSEALCLLPCLTAAAVPGLTLGCLIANILSGCILWDTLFGTFATFLGALGTRLLREKGIISALPPVLSNTIIVPLILSYAYHLDQALGWLMLSVGLGELLSCGVLGTLLLGALRRCGVGNRIET